MTEKRFKNCLNKFDKAKQKLEREKTTFIFDVTEFMRDKGIPIRVLFFGDEFGLDIVNGNNFRDVPRTIPLNILMDFCDEFGCEYLYTNCGGNRWIFSFNGLDMRH